MAVAASNITAKYRVLICDLMTDQILDVLPVSNVSYDAYIGKTGTCTGSIQVTSRQAADRVRVNFVPARTAVYIVRNSDIRWGGVLWTRTPTVNDRGYVTVDFQASTFDTYFARRIVYDDLTYTATDQLDIARNLISYAQAFAGGDIGVVAGANTSGVVRDRTYLRYDHSSVMELIDQLSKVDNGFEWRFYAYTASSGLRVRALQLGYPRIAIGSNDTVLTSPGPIVGYTLPEDGSTVANVWQSRGATINDDVNETSYPLMSSQYFYPTDLDAGWPRLDGSSDYNTVSDVNTLNAHALADIARYRRSIVIPEVNVLVGGNNGAVPPIGSYVKLRIQDIWFSEAVVLRHRVVGVAISPPERGRPEVAKLYLENG